MYLFNSNQFFLFFFIFKFFHSPHIVFPSTLIHLPYHPIYLISRVIYLIYISHIPTSNRYPSTPRATFPLNLSTLRARPKPQSANPKFSNHGRPYAANSAKPSRPNVQTCTYLTIFIHQRQPNLIIVQQTLYSHALRVRCRSAT